MSGKSKAPAALAVIFALGMVLAGCSGGSKPITLALNFSGTQAIDNGQSVAITVTGAGPKGVSWSLASAGTLSNATTTSVTYNAPAGPLTAAVTDHLTATSLDDSTKNVVLTINVTPSPSITTTSPLPNGIVGTAYNQTVTATGGAGTLAFTVSVGTLPAGLSLSSAGAITGSPTTVGTTSFTVKVTDSSIGGTQSATKALSITVNQAPAITSANNVTFVVGTAGTFTVTATGTPTPSLTETGTLPTGVTFTPATGVLSGTPVAGTAGSYPIMFTASNGVGTAATQNFTLTVGQPPAITSANSTTFTVGTAGTFTVTATGFPAPTFSETGALPTGVTLNATTGVLSGTPGAGTGKTYSITITASNGVGSNATQSFTLTVDQAPAITSAISATFTVGTLGTFTVTASGFPVPSLSETGTLPTGVIFTSATGVLSGTPAAGTAGSYPIMFTASNGIGTAATQNFTLTVGQPPAITSANSATFTVGTAGTFTVTATGFPAPTFSETGALPTGVTLNATTGVLSGTPGAGTGKTYSITITASNGVGSNATQSFTLTVDQAPAITSAISATFTVGALGTFTVTTTGFPAPGLTETGTLPNGVTFTDNGNGTATLSGTPASGSANTYALTITANNGVTPNATQSFTLTVNTAPVITSANNTTFTVGTAGSFTVTATGTPTPTLSETGALPTGVTFTASTGVLSGTPAAGTGGTYPITFTASNGVGSPGTQSFTLTVNQAPAITSATSTTFTENVSASFTVMTTGFPKPALSELGALPTGVIFTDNGNGTATLSGTPASGSANTYALTITANNGVTPNATQSFTLTVNTAPVITSGSSTTFTVGTPGTFTVTATGTPTPTLSETGALPTGVTFTASTGVLTGTPGAGTGGTYPITFKATSTSGSTSQSFTLTVNQAPAITSATSTTFTVGTNGSFTVTTTGFPLDPITETGALPSGVTFVDNGDNTATLSGTPAAGTAGSYSLMFTATNGIGSPATQSFTLTVSAAAACTTTGGSESLLSGGYAFLLKGFDSSGEPALVGGVLTFNGSGSITAGAIDMNLDTTQGGVQSLTVSSGTYGVGSDHRGCMAITTPAGTQHYAFSVANIASGVASTAHVIDFDAAGPFTTGTMLKQSGGPFSTTSVSGTYVFGGSSIQNSAAGGGKFGIAGIIAFNGSGGITSGSEDINQNGFLDGDTTGTVTSFPATSPITFGAGSTYTMVSNGRGTMTIAILLNGVAAATSHAFLYGVSSSHAFFMTSDAQTGTQITGGEALKQSGAPFAANPLSGTYVGYDSGLGKGGAGTDRTDLFLVGPQTSGSSTLSFTQYRNDGGTFSSGPQAGSYSSSSTGRMLVTGAGGHEPVLYLVSTSQAFLLTGNGSVDTGFIQSQTGVSASMAYAFGIVDPEDTNVGANSGVVTLTSGSITGTSDNNSAGGGLQGNQAISTTYSVDANGLGHVPSGCTPGTNCQLIFLVVSPTRAVLTELQHSNGTAQASPAINPIDQ